MKRPTIADVAKTAGPSAATVDRVLNGRLPVREETSRKVFAAAEKLGFHGTNIIRQRMMADMPSYQSFTENLHAAAAAVKDRPVHLTIAYGVTERRASWRS